MLVGSLLYSEKFSCILWFSTLLSEVFSSHQKYLILPNSSNLCESSSFVVGLHRYWKLTTIPFFSAITPCQVGHNCSQVCYTDNNKTAKCACFANYELQSDGKTCRGALICCSLKITNSSPPFPSTWIVPSDKQELYHARGSSLYFLGGDWGWRVNSPIE